MNDGKFDFGFAVDWMRKDLGICLAEAKRNGAKLPVTRSSTATTPTCRRSAATAGTRPRSSPALWRDHPDHWEPSSTTRRARARSPRTSPRGSRPAVRHAAPRPRRRRPAQARIPEVEPARPRADAGRGRPGPHRERGDHDLLRRRLSRREHLAEEDLGPGEARVDAWRGFPTRCIRRTGTTCAPAALRGRRRPPGRGEGEGPRQFPRLPRGDRQAPRRPQVVHRATYSTRWPTRICSCSIAGATAAKLPGEGPASTTPHS